jgi:ATP-dependent DNA helicase RecG
MNYCYVLKQTEVKIEMEEMNLQELLFTLTEGWENEIVEFKDANDNYPTNDIGKYFSALANEANLRSSKQGWLVFGIDNKTRKIIGTDYRRSEERLNGLKMQITEGTDPSISFRKIHVLNHEDGRVIIFEIPAAPIGIPVAWKGHFYSRSGESLVALSLDKLETISNEEQEKDWSAQIVHDATIADLDEEAIALARKNFVIKHRTRFTEKEVNSWSLETFLERARVTRSGKITKAALLLLGKEEASHFLTPHPAQLTWKLVGEEQGYQHFSPPFLLNTTRLYNCIRNVQKRILPLNSLIAVEVSKYDKDVVLEGLHNCIAHQDYTKNSRIIVTEYLDRLTLYNVGNFYDGEPQDYFYGEKTPSRYRNPFLATAMAELNMIDTIGYGIFEMLKEQAKRGFPLQDYDTNNDSVIVTIYGQIIDKLYSAILLEYTNLSLKEIILLDRVQKKLPISPEGRAILRKAKLIEGRYPNIKITRFIDDFVISQEAELKELLHQAEKINRPTHGFINLGDSGTSSSLNLDFSSLKNNSLVISILQCLCENNMSKSEIAKFNNLKPKTGNFTRAFMLLLKLGLITSIEAKIRSSKQAYKITNIGKLFLAMNQ